MMFLDCPAWLDRDGAERCGLPAEVKTRFIMRSTDGPMESAMIQCPAGHYFCGTIESLTWHGQNKHDPGSAAVTSRAGHDSVQGSHDGADRPAIRDYPAEPDPDYSRPNTAPASYLGRPARLWITVMRPRHERTTSRHPMPTVTHGKQTPPGHSGLEPSRRNRPAAVAQAGPEATAPTIKLADGDPPHADDRCRTVPIRRNHG